MPPDLPDTPLDPLEAAKRAIDARRGQKRNDALPLVCGTDIPLEAPEHIWSERMPLGELSLLDGEPSEGKSTLLIQLMARITKGARMPFDGVDREPATVLWYGPEENTRKAAMPRFVAAGGDRARFFEIRRAPDVPAFSLPSNEKQVDRWISALKAQGHNVRMLAIDGLSVIMDPLGPGGRPLSENSAADVQLVLDALLRLARKHNLAVFGLRHLGKSQTAALNNRGLGSKKWEGLARAHWIAVPHPDDKTKRLLVPLKHTYAAPFPKTLVYEIVGCDVQMSNGATRNYGLVNFLSESDLTKHDLGGIPSKNPRVPKAEIAEACDAIMELLAEKKRGFTDSQLLEELKDMGHSAAALGKAVQQLFRTKQASPYKAGGAWGIQPLGGNLRAVPPPPPPDDEAPF